jgi:hypothetical protein
MAWYVYLAHFVGGAFLANAVPPLREWHLRPTVPEPLLVAARPG